MDTLGLLNIRQQTLCQGRYSILLLLRRPAQPQIAPIEAEAKIEFALTGQEQQDLRWYLEDSLQNPGSVEAAHVAQIETMMRERGEELYRKVLPDRRMRCFRSM